jgi:16S rRNA processing protein RimM
VREEEFIAVGKIRGPHGLKGEVEVISLTEYPARFEPGARIFASVREGKKSLIVEGSRQGKKGLLIKFKGIETRSQAEELDKALLEIPLGEAAALPRNTYWRHDIIGLKVYTSQGEFLGTISGIMETGSNDVYTVKTNSEEVLIPAIKDVIKKVDLTRKKMVIEPLPGLFE